MMEKQHSRRALLRMFGAAPALAILPAAAMTVALRTCAGPDPVYAAIERHRATFAAFGQACLRTDHVLARNQGREVTQADEDAYEQANAIDEAALDDLISTPPTTLAGMRAVLKHVKPDDDSCVRIVETLLKSPLF